MDTRTVAIVNNVAVRDMILRLRPQDDSHRLAARTVTHD
jgi:hypothetical protein